MPDTGYMVPLTYHTFIVNNGYKDFEFVRAENGIYSKTVWAESDFLSFSTNYIENNGLIHVFPDMRKIKEDNFYNEIVDHILFHIKTQKYFKNCRIHVPNSIDGEKLKSLIEKSGILFIPFKHENWAKVFTNRKILE